MEITFLGTGAGVPAKHRNVSSLILRFPEYDGDQWIFDCGEGTQHQVLHTNLRLTKVSRIFITHLHGDHIYGLPGVLGSRSFHGSTEPLTIYGPKGIQEFVDVTLGVSKTHLHYPIEYVELQDGLTFSTDFFHITVRLLEHGIPSYGFRLEEKEKPGKLEIERLQALGIPSGPLLGKLKRGEVVELPDGTVLDGRDFLGPPTPGKVYAILGDTRPTPSIEQLARHADLLVHEATRRSGDEELANLYFHSTIAQATELAKRAEVKMLLINHISTRYVDNLEELQQEASAQFEHSIVVQDFDQFVF
ncbi:ribonuclease Z [Risungbinella massiliensis]|uniref:ribonuclease Z n=1 Tax=Risungbinella massiliensis TaxID=1329796 RepID=UPI0005CC5638|nr:ribonuclease Z [Risungbinella massiliensis]